MYSERPRSEINGNTVSFRDLSPCQGIIISRSIISIHLDIDLEPGLFVSLVSRIDLKRT